MVTGVGSGEKGGRGGGGIVTSVTADAASGVGERALGGEEEEEGEGRSDGGFLCCGADLGALLASPMCSSLPEIGWRELSDMEAVNSSISLQPSLQEYSCGESGGGREGERGIEEEREKGGE